jgi:Family of unknown function (DUF6165)
MTTEDRASRPTPLVPLSWGELLDKISILEIKAERIVSAPARSNVRMELSALSAIASELDGDQRLEEWKRALKGVNEALWSIEDRLREKEAQAAFDQEFIELARSVYKTNDRRACIKREINLSLGSQLIEEKQYKD